MYIVLEKVMEKINWGEFMRYVLVGLLSFLVDATFLILGKEIFFAKQDLDAAILLATAGGFIAGLLCNYILSQFIVFSKPEQRERGLTGRAFMKFAVIGFIGLILTELGMYFGVQIVGHEGFYYLLVKCVVGSLVLIWNYSGRKIWIYKGI